MGGSWILWILLLPLVLFFIMGGVIRLQHRRKQEVLRKFKGRKIYGVTSGANFFGVESEGWGQVRGNGVLLLADSELYFEMWVPSKKLSIPFSALRGAEVTMSHLAKTKARPLLKVHYLNAAGAEDSAAWLVNHLPQWTSAIEKIISLQIQPHSTK